MTQRSSTSPVTSSPNTATQTNGTVAPANLAALLQEHVPEYANGTPSEQSALLADAEHAHREGLGWDEYLEALAEYLAGGTVAEYLAESAPALEQAPKPEQTEQAAPAEDKAAELAAKAAEQKQAAEQAEQEGRSRAVTLLQECVKVYKRGEVAYSRCLLHTGELADLYIAQRLTLGKGERPAAVQQLVANLGLWSTTVVDAKYVNALVASWNAYSLLAGGTGLDKAPEQEQGKGKKARPVAPADNVPWSHYRDAWSLVVERVQPDSPEEHWAILPHVQAECLDVFKAAVQGSLSKAASVLKAQELALLNTTRANLAKAELAKQAKAAADALAKESGRHGQQLAQEQEAHRAAVQANQAEHNAELRASAALQLAAQEQELRDKKAKQDLLDKQAKDAKDRQAEADRVAAAAKEAQDKADAKAKAKADKAKADANKPATPATAAPPSSEPALAEGQKRCTSCRQGTDALTAGRCQSCHAKYAEPRGQNPLAILATAARAAQPKDFATMLAGPVFRADDTLAVVHELAIALTHTPEQAEDYGPDDVALALLLGLKDSTEVSPQTRRAIQAALAVLGNGPSVSPAEVANALTTKPAQQPAVA